METIKLNLLKDLGQEGVLSTIKSYIPSNLKLGENPHRTIVNYSQEGNTYCTGFASAGAFVYNTGLVLTNEYVMEWCKRYIPSAGVFPLARAVELFAKDHGCIVKSFQMDSVEAKLLREAGYALVNSTVCPKDLWIEFVKFGKKMKPGLYLGTQGGHALFSILEKDRNYFVNSWGQYAQQYFNKYNFDLQDMMNCKYIRPICYLIYKKP